MRSTSWRRAALLAAIAVCCAPVRAEMIDAVVATVDKNVILYSDLMSQVGASIDELRKTATSQEQFQREADQLVLDALDNSIERLIMAREARKYPEFEVSDKELELQIEQIRKDRGYTSEKFIEEIGGSMTEYREWVRQQIAAQRLAVSRTQAFEKEVVISDQEISDYYNEHRDEFQREERVYVRQIQLRAEGDEEQREQARAKLELIREEILNGADFGELAKLHSQAFNAEIGGAIGWQQRGDLAEPLNSVAFSLPAGGLSEVIESQFGLQLLYVEKREEAGVTELSDIALEIESVLRKEAANKRYQTWLADLRKRSRVRIFYR